MTTAGWVCLLGFIPLSIGLPLYWLSGKGHEPAESVEVAAGVIDKAEDRRFRTRWKRIEKTPPTDSFREMT